MNRLLLMIIVLIAAGAFARPGNAAYSFSAIDIPGAFETYAFGISGGNIGGYYSDASGTHGFLAAVPLPSTILLFGTGLAALALSRRRFIK